MPIIYLKIEFVEIKMPSVNLPKHILLQQAIFIQQFIKVLVIII